MWQPGGREAECVPQVEAGQCLGWRVEAGLSWEEEPRSSENPSLSVSRWRVNTPSLTVSITNKGDWRSVVVGVVVVCGELVLHCNTRLQMRNLIKNTHSGAVAVVDRVHSETTKNQEV